MTALLYGAVFLLLLTGIVGMLVLRGRLRKHREMQVLFAVMQQAMDMSPAAAPRDRRSRKAKIRRKP